jgi:hypothetical protein
MFVYVCWLVKKAAWGIIATSLGMILFYSEFPTTYKENIKMYFFKKANMQYAGVFGFLFGQSIIRLKF